MSAILAGDGHRHNCVFGCCFVVACFTRLLVNVGHVCILHNW